MAAVIDRCSFSESTLQEALSLIEEVASLPTFGARWLRKLARDGFGGEVTVDVSNVLQLSLGRGPLGASRAPTEDDLRPLQWWAALARGSVLRMDDRAVLAIEPFVLVDTPLITAPADATFDAVSALSAWGYKLPFAVAVALSAAASAAPERTLVRATRTRGRGGSLDVVELSLPAAGDGARDALTRLARSAGARAAFALVFSEGDGWGYLEGFNEEFGSDNYAPPEPPEP